MSNRRPTNTFQGARLDRAERIRLLRTCGLLSRPELSGKQINALHRIIENSRFRPLPRLPSLSLLEPLYSHHLIQVGYRFEDVFEPGGQPLPEDPGLLARRYYSRTGFLQQAFDALHDVGRVMLLKGAALGPLYPSPALRQMSDADLVVSAEALPRAEAALLNCGWTRREHLASLVFRHESGFLIDLHAPRSSAARRIYSQAVSHPLLNNAAMPRPGHHLYFIAYHAAMHAGARIWRDVCDMQLLLSGNFSAAGHSLQFARNSPQPGRASLCALFRIINRFTMPERMLPERTEHWTAADERETRRILRIYLSLAADPTPPLALDLLRPVASPLTALHARFRARNGPSRWRERDPVLGDVPCGGSVQRQFFRLGLFFSLMKSGRVAHYLSLCRSQQQLGGAKPLFGGKQYNK